MDKKVKSRFVLILSAVFVIVYLLFKYNPFGGYMPFWSIPDVRDFYEFGPYFENAHLSTEFVFPERLPEVPGEMMVYKRFPTIKPAYEEMKRIGDVFGMGSGIKVYSREDKVIYSKKGYAIEFYDSDSFTYQIFLYKSADELNLPDKKEAQNIAETFLKNKGLWIDGLKLEGFSYNKKSSPEIGIKSTKMSVDYELEKFENRIRTAGRVKITIIQTESGPKIKRLKYYIGKSKAYRPVKTITPKEAIEKIYKGDAYFWFNEGPYSKVIVDEFKLVYQGTGTDIGNPSDYIHPMYELTGLSDDGGPFTITVHAIEDHYIKKSGWFGWF